jgi:DNA-binding beta-propeller fold protein YncE
MMNRLHRWLPRAAMAIACIAGLPASAGTLYLSDTGTQSGFVEFDTGSQTILRSWAGLDPAELPFALDTTLRSRSRFDATGSGAEYTLDGTPTGTTYAQALNSLSGFVLLVDGTQDATHNYAVDAVSGTVFTFDRNWSGGSVLFTLPTTGTSLWTGIAYDATNNSLWATDSLNNTIADFAPNGTLLSSFVTSSQFPGSLALDPTDQTLWTANIFPGILDQYSKDGTHLQVVQSSDLSTLEIGGMEFAPVATPEPGAFGLAALGLIVLIGVKSRVSCR